MKKIISIILSLAMVLSMSATAFAAEQTLPMQPANSDGFIEITEEYIEKYGVHTVDEFGNKIIEVPLGPDMSYISDPITTDEEVHEGVHEGHSYPEGMIQPYHFSLTPHSHEVVNVTSVQYSNYIPVTQYAMAGFTISKEYNGMDKPHFMLGFAHTFLSQSHSEYLPVYPCKRTVEQP